MKILNKVYEDYFKYLCNQVEIGKRNGFEKLALALFETDYTYIILDDESREIDGMEERERFIYSYKNANSIEKIFLQDDFSCSVFEMMLGISRRMNNFVYSLEDGSQIYLCFHTLLDNLGLSIFNDKNFDKIYVDNVLYNLINRKYKSNGQGSLFPLKNPISDAREMPIWQQMTSFINENNSILPKSLGYIL